MGGEELPAGAQAGSDEEALFQFHHVQVFVKELKPLSEYKQVEEKLNTLARNGTFDPFSGMMRFLEPNALHSRVLEGRQVWQSLSTSGSEKPEPEEPETEYHSWGQDFVEQLIVGLGWRITAEYQGTGTRTVLVTSSDPCGIKYCITTASRGEEDLNAETEGSQWPGADGPEEPYRHFSKSQVSRFMEAHGGRQGIGIMAFEVSPGSLTKIFGRYRDLHPSLLVDERIFEYLDTRSVTSVDSSGVSSTKTIELGKMKVFEAFAYYEKEQSTTADKGTVLRFVERSGTFSSSPGFANPEGVLPGLRDADPKFDGTSIPAYSDHWVSNVIDRVGFLKTLHETLGFTPKVEFNAGVVSAGAATIESTVVGNKNAPPIFSPQDALKNQSQVYLPVNNALSDAGHVHGFIEELGQGVQHLASRVENLVAFVERVNNYRTITGKGLSFLSIPRSYYGILNTKDLVSSGVSAELANDLTSKLVESGLMTPLGVLNLDISDEQIAQLDCASETLQLEFKEKLPTVTTVVKRGRYKNLYDLLRDNLDENLYLQIVRNQILVDIQGGDILFQIFTCRILQNEAAHEAPFLEFIERVCKECRDGECSGPIKPGCGGFGIRNFLTLFLSMELSKAIRDHEEAVERRDEHKVEMALKKMQLLNQQMDESNPILTAISDAMTAEGHLLDLCKNAEGHALQALKDKVGRVTAEKEQLVQRLQQLSDSYNTRMRAVSTASQAA